jgi:hypothetical protein
MCPDLPRNHLSRLRYGDRHLNLIEEAGYKHQLPTAAETLALLASVLRPLHDLNAHARSSSSSVRPSRPARSVALEERTKPVLRTSQTCIRGMGAQLPISRR